MSVETTTSNSTSSELFEASAELLVAVIRGISFTVISFVLFMLCPISLFVAVSPADTVPLWFLGMQTLIFFFMAHQGLPIVWYQLKQSIF